MSSVHVNVHTHDDGIDVKLSNSEFATWLEFRSGGQSVTIFVEDVWQLVSMADRIVQLVEEQEQMQIWPRSISAEGNIVAVPD